MMNIVSPPARTPDTSLRESPDAVLLQRWTAQRREADFTELVRRHLGLVRGAACRQLGEDRADDTAQAVFAILARRAASLGAVRSLSAWLHQVTMLQCRNAVRRLQRERRIQSAAMENATLNAARDPLENALPLLDAALAALGESDRELMLLRYSEGLSFAEASRRTGRSEAALRQQAGRALEKLSGHLRRRGVALPAAALSSGLGAALCGPGTADAAALCGRASLAAAQKLSAGTLAAIAFSTMNTTQSIFAGAAAALLLAGGPVAWRIHQANEARADSANTAPSRPAAITAPEIQEAPSHQPASEPAPAMEKITTGAEADIERIFEDLVNGEIRASMDEWTRRGAWLEARRMGRLLSLTPQKERELRTFIEDRLRARMNNNIPFGDSDRSDPGTEGDDRGGRRVYEASLAEWYAANLTPEQNAHRQEAEKARREALVEMLAEDALHGINAAVSLTEDQKTKLYDAAAAKAAKQLADNDYGGSMQIGAAVSRAPAPSLEDRSGDLLTEVLDPAQLELWEQSCEQDRLFGEVFPRRFADRALSVIRERGLLSTLLPMARGIFDNTNPAP